VEEAIAGFDWDDGNRSKWLKHGVSGEEVESLFMRPIMILPDEAHSVAETRFKAIGQAAGGRHVFLVFTNPRAERQAVHSTHQPATAQEGNSAL